MKEISKSNFLSLGQTTGILNLPSSVVATPARKVLSGKVNKRINPEKPDVPLNKNDAFQKVQKRRVQEKR